MLVRDKYEQILQDYEMCHPYFYEQTVDWWASGKMTIAVELKNGNLYEFDNLDKTLRCLRSKNCNVDEDILNREFGANVRKNIPLTGKTQKELCEEIGITNAMLSRYIHGNSAPSAAKAYKIAKAIGCTMDELFDETYMD